MSTNPTPAPVMSVDDAYTALHTALGNLSGANAADANADAALASAQATKSQTAPAKASCVAAVKGAYDGLIAAAQAAEGALS